MKLLLVIFDNLFDLNAMIVNYLELFNLHILFIYLVQIIFVNDACLIAFCPVTQKKIINITNFFP